MLVRLGSRVWDARAVEAAMHMAGEQGAGFRDQGLWTGVQILGLVWGLGCGLGHTRSLLKVSERDVLFRGP